MTKKHVPPCRPVEGEKRQRTLFGMEQLRAARAEVAGSKRPASQQGSAQGDARKKLARGCDCREQPSDDSEVAREGSQPASHGSGPSGPASAPLPVSAVDNRHVELRSSGLPIQQWAISRFPRKTAELRKQPCRKTTGTQVALFECGAGWTVGGQAAWVARFHATFAGSEAVARSRLADHRHAHQLAPEEVDAYLAGYASTDEAYLWHFASIKPVDPPKLRIVVPGEQGWIRWSESELLDMSRGVRGTASTTRVEQC